MNGEESAEVYLQMGIIWRGIRDEHHSMKSVRTEYNLIEKEKRSQKAGEIA